jgi:hypothetical protein
MTARRLAAATALRWSARPRAAVLAAALLVSPSALRAQDITVELFTGGQEWVRRDGTVELVLSRWPATDEGQIAVVVGNQDRSELFRRTDRGLAYRPELLPLPPGQSEVVVYLVDPRGRWTQLGRFPLRVLQRGGVEAAAFAPRLDLGVKAQVYETHAPAGNAPPRDDFQDGTFQLALAGSAQRAGWTLSPTMDVVGTSFRGEALRFGSEGERAPQVDLARYGLRLARGEASLQVGELVHGEHRLLMQSFSSRGLALSVPVGGRARLSLIAANGSQIVGWDNLLGVAESRHRVLTGTLGVELLKRPGGLRVDGSWLDGSLLPVSPFNQGLVTDAETARGWGLRLLAATPSQRLRLDGGWARTRFDNPADPTLAQGNDLVAVEAESRDARYLDLTLGLLARPLPRVGQTTATLTLRHSRVEPLYRTIGAFVQADRDGNGADLAVQAGPAALLLSWDAFEDNLDRIPSITTTRNRRQTANLALPLGQLWPSGAGPRNWLPLLSWSFDRNHQYGLGVAPGSGMRPDQIPDQVSRNEAAALDWQAGGLRLGLRLGDTRQDNRQPGRERADFDTRTETLTAGGSLGRALDLGVELGRERTDNVELASERELRRWGLDLTWRVLPRLTLAAAVSRTRDVDDAGPAEGHAWNSDVQLVWAFERRRAATSGGAHGGTGQLFVRWLDQRADSRQPTFGFATETEAATVNAGINLSLF